MDDALRSILDAFVRGGVSVVAPNTQRCFSVGTVAALIEMKPAYVKKHIDEFPGWFRLPGGGQNGGEIRIPERAVTAFQQRGKTT